MSECGLVEERLHVKGVVGIHAGLSLCVGEPLVSRMASGRPGDDGWDGRNRSVTPWSGRRDAKAVVCCIRTC